MSLTLSGITLGSGLTLSPAFDPQNFEYTVDMPQSLESVSVVLTRRDDSTLGKAQTIGSTPKYTYASIGYYNANDEMTKMAMKDAIVATNTEGSYEVNPQTLNITHEDSAYLIARIEVYSLLLEQSKYYTIRFNVV